MAERPMTVALTRLIQATRVLQFKCPSYTERQSGRWWCDCWLMHEGAHQNRSAVRVSW